MITLHTWTTPNGRKPIILLEELGVPYETVPVDIGNGEQFQSEFLKLSPNNKIPAMVDDNADDNADDEAGGGPLSLFESGAILTYLADKHGKFLAPSGAARWQAMQWLHWQIGGLGPMLGQLGFFSKQDDAFALERFVTEGGRLLTVLDTQLGKARYVAGDDYTIADIACYPWVMAASERLQEPLADALGKPNIQRWLALVGARPAVQKGMRWKPRG
ncbi:glutathione S-transferase N-terminal domain-containing protein [Pseudoduganella sp. SL102]|uniref:glutathione S-transferase family protein n=1 Tax=Pseudoduganella sp. SL102 TaxID=2995154 RepID=UPI00248B2C5E|nr:glutathione S-transferase N-terminal domain-containing protein [Pseudoduganella sp. SL102]WBS01694.1 glutathione S-transferase N-terminal domain-containing protein [Pseudoduganella sp. SL102]